MPVDRFFHPRAGHSKKVTGLSDQDFRAWWTYVLAADDYGVMRRSAVTLQAANDSLEKRSIKSVDRSFDRIVEVGLVVAFEHQGEAFVCQLDWQDFQKVRYPRESHLPIPPDDVLAKCSASTQELFRQRSRKTSETPPENSGGSPGSVPQFPRVRAHEEANANGKRLTADGSAPERVTDAFRAHWKRTYGVESTLIINHLQFMDLERQLDTCGEQKILTAMAAFFATDDPYVRKARHPLALFLRDPTKYLATDAAVQSRPKGCTHMPACADAAAHTTRYLSEQKAS